MSMKYTEDHEWISVDGDIATVGITHHAQDALGDVVFVDLPEVGKTLAQKDVAGVVESVKAAADVYMPVSGEITEVNEALRADPSLANSDPMGNGWFFKVHVTDMAEFDQLMDPPGYDALLKGVARRDFDQIMAWSVDRLGRSLPDLVSFLSDIQSKNVDLYLHQQGLDTSTPSGRMMFQMLSVFAEFERAMIRERILAGLRRTTKKSGRKPMPDDRVEAIRRSLIDGLGIRATARLHRASPMTVTAIKRSMESIPA